MTEKKKNQKPTVLAFEKKLVPSDALMSSMAWPDKSNHECEDGGNKVKPLKLVEKTIRGTKSYPGTSENKAVDANPQKVDNCALPSNHDTLLLHFTLKVLSGVDNPSTCNNPTWLEKCKEIVKKYIDKHSFTEISHRYAHNIANARFLWRNRVGADNIETHVKLADANESEPLVTFKAANYVLNKFEDDEKVKMLAEKIAAVLCGDKSYELFHIDTCARVGMGQEVYPSEEFIDKENVGNKKGTKSKELYGIKEVDGTDRIAAMHSQKIGNALRTIDTWYLSSEEEGDPIAIEPFGSVTNKGIALRYGKKSDFYTLLHSWALNKKELSDKEQHYVMAVLVRGGVFGESGK